MPYGKDITEGLPYVLSNPSGNTSFSKNAEDYDIAIAGKPFFLMITDQTPYRRQTAPYRKQQIDQSSEPGEQSITGWWVRAQSSFHSGSGIKYYDPSAGETVAYRFADSQGVNVWDKGNVSLLKDVITGHNITGSISANGRVKQHLRSIEWSGYSGALSHDEYDVDKIYAPITVSITNKVLTSNVATLTTSTTHNLTVGMQIDVTGVDATFNGTYIITAVTSNTFSYAKTATNVTSTAVSPVGSATSDVIHFIDYNSGTDSPVYAVCDDGTYAYWITNTATKKTVYKKPLTGNATSSADVVTMFDEIGTVANATMEYVKDRIVMCADNKVYEFATSATAMPSPVYTHPTTTHLYTSVAASGPAIYIAGYNGIQSTIQKFTLNTSGAMPTLTGGAAVAAEMPVGEVVHVIKYYLGYLLIGTNKGIRVALISDQDGSLNYGPLIVETSQPCYDFAMRDKYVWCATSVNGMPGTIRIDLSNQIETLMFAWANDVYKSGVTGNVTTACAFMDGTNRLAFVSAFSSAGSGYVYIEEATKLVPSGYITTGRIRYGTLENKIFKTLRAIADNALGSLVVSSIDRTGAEYVIGNFGESDSTPDMSVSYPIGPQEYMSFKFTLGRSANNSNYGCVLDGYQLKGTPAIPRQRLIQYPLACYDTEKDSYGNQVGYEGAAFAKLTALEDIEDAGDTVRIEDFRTGESHLGIIEELNFINSTPTDKRFSGFGGILLATIRTI